jgi:2-(1,2-epoxy-1,2-dihydrophenyl)acetyl-CoA isomerase
VGDFSVSDDGAVAVVTLDKPSVGNAIDADTAAALAVTFDELSAGRRSARAVLLRSEGRHFCTGADLRAAGTGQRPVNGDVLRGLAAGFHKMVSSVFHCRLPVIAAVHGTAQGAGLHLALAADFVIAGERATFRDPFTERGFSVDTGGSWLLPRLIGLTRAKRFLYMAEEIDAATALEWGLIDELVADADLYGIARRRASALAARPTQALAATKRLLHDSATANLDAALHAEAMAIELTMRSKDFKEGMAAFSERRPPKFTGT